MSSERLQRSFTSRLGDGFDHNITRNTVSAILLKVVGAGLGFLYTMLLAHFLGAKGSGTFFLSLTVTSFASLVSRLGMDNALLRFASSAAAKNDWAAINGVHREALTIATYASIISIIILLVGAPFLANTFFSSPDLTNPLRIMALSILPLSILNLEAELLKAVRRTATALFVQGVGIPFIAMVMFLASTEDGVVGAAAAYLVSTIVIMIVSVITSYRSLRMFPNVARFNRRLLMSTSVPLFAIALLNVLIAATDTIMIGIFLDSEAVGVYNVALRISSLGSLLLVVANTVLSPHFSAMWSLGQKEEIERIARKATLVMAAAASLILLVFLSTSVQIMNVFSPEFAHGAPVLIILAFGQFITLATGPAAHLLMMTGHAKHHRTNLLISGLLNIVLNAIMIPLWGTVGAAVATGASLAVKNAIALVQVRKHLGFKLLF